MISIRKGDRGPAVEDVQRRLLALGEDLGSTGVDGVFLGATYAAVCEFQHQRGLAEDGLVGPETWSALVDASFILGDRLLYLRLPHFHGADVATLQGALNALGFACGSPDGIFGAYSERAVRDFQANTGLPVDGIAGPDTVRTISNLRHVWSDKGPDVPDGLLVAPARATEALSGVVVCVAPTGDVAGSVAARLRNLAEASDPPVTVGTGGQADLTIEMVVAGEAHPVEGAPLVSAGDGGESLTRRLVAAIAAGETLPGCVVVTLDGDTSGEHELQRVAVGLLDGLCLGVAAASRNVVT